MHITPEDLEYFKRVGAQEPKLREFLQAFLNEQVTSLILQVSEPTLRTAQGQAQAYQKLLKLLEGAPSNRA